MTPTRRARRSRTRSSRRRTPSLLRRGLTVSALGAALLCVAPAEPPVAAAVPVAPPSAGRVELPPGFTPFAPIKIRMWDWQKTEYHPADWDYGGVAGPKRLLAGNVVDTSVLNPPGRDVLIKVTADGAGELKHLRLPDGAPASSKAGRWEVVATMPQMREGLIAAPLWIWDEAPEIRDEIDFEVVGLKGLQVTVHRRKDADKNNPNLSAAKLVIPGDLSGRTLRLGIEYRAGQSVVFYVDGKEVHRLRPSDHPTGQLPDRPMFANHMLWPTPAAEWAGKWEPLKPGQEHVMRLHGRRFTAL